MLLVLAIAAGAGAETVRERSIDIEITPQGTLIERTRLVVGLRDADDAQSWTTYRLALEANRALESLEAQVRRADGSVRRVGEDAREQVARRVGGVLFSSQRDLLVHLAPLQAGDQLEIEHVIRFAPYFPASHVNLRGIGGVERLRLRVGGRDDLRWRVVGPQQGLVMLATAGGVEVSGRDLPPLEVPPHAPEDARHTRLVFAWGPARQWSDVGRWYGQQVAALPPPPAVAAAAQAETAAANRARDKLDLLIDFLDRQVRYVAVTVGEGNIRPSPAGETLERGWGDCKDKAVLLAAMLHSVGIEAYPALVRSDRDGRVDPAFPALFPFNHAITAVPVTAVEVAPGDPVAGGYLFVDTTQARAAGRWLAPALQGQQALIVEPGGGRLVETPLLPGAEHRRFVAELVVDAAGTARGRIDLELHGETADRVLTSLERLPAAEAEAEARALIASFLPGAVAESVVIAPLAAPVPAFRIQADVVLPSLVQGLDGSRPSLQLPGLHAAPDPRVLEARQIAAALPLAWVTAHWRLQLPAGPHCRLPAATVTDAAPVGRFAQRVTYSPGGILEVDRETLLAQRFVEGEDLAALEALALAEHRTHRRRVRLDCTDP